MRRDDALLLDMLIAARKIQQFTSGVDWASFETNTMVQSAVIREIQVVGEAARQVSDITRTAQPRIPPGRDCGYAPPDYPRVFRYRSEHPMGYDPKRYSAADRATHGHRTA